MTLKLFYLVDQKLMLSAVAKKDVSSKRDQLLRKDNDFWRSDFLQNKVPALISLQSKVIVVCSTIINPLRILCFL